LERTFPQKVKPVPSCEVEEGVMVSQIRQTPPEINRLVRTSAAVIGLAISMGAYNLPSQTDEAVAAEPLAGEPIASAASSEFDVAAVPYSADRTEQAQSLSSGIVEHTVQEGQTLWQLAQFYKIDAATVALANGISANAVLHVGQVLKVSTDRQVTAVAQAAEAVSNLPGYYGPIEAASSVDVSQKAVSQAQYSEVLNALRQKQERLRQSLAQLKASHQGKEAVSTLQVAPELTVSAAAYRVVPGDTLESIAKARSVSWEQLAAANSLSNPNVLSVNQVLVMPQVPAEVSLVSPTEVPVIIASANPSRVMLQRSANVRPKANRSQKPMSIPATAKTEFAVGETHGSAVLAAQTAQVPAAELMPTVSLTHSSVAPIAIGGSAEVATASFTVNQPAQAEQSGSGVQPTYVENLRLEIVKLREKYQGSANQDQATVIHSTKVAASPLNIAAPANPESSSNGAEAKLEPTRYTKALQAQIRQLHSSRQQNRRDEMQSAAADLAPTAARSEPQLVATASIGSQSYEPLLSSSVGKMVSPDLPPLGSVDAYLPGNTGKFNGYIWPAKGVLTSGYGWRWGRMHRGIDIAAPVGTPVFAAAAGVVITAGWNSGGYGNMVEIQHPNGSVTLYAHNSRLVVREGQEVAQGQQIADMGSTGYSTGPHSHFEVRLPGQGAVNPMAYLPRGQS